MLPPDTPVGVDVVEAVELRDTVLDVKTAPNRGDILSMRGIAREVALLLGKELKLLDLTVPEAGRPAGDLAPVAVEDAEGRPLYAARVIQTGRGLAQAHVDGQAVRPVRPAAVGRWSTSPLPAVGPGQPLHAFDLDLRRVAASWSAGPPRTRPSAPSTAATAPSPPRTR